MASYPHNSASGKAKPWPAYFIVRTSGEVVPLIGVDELPVGTNLIGVPRALDLKDTIGMLNLGIQRSSEAFYRIAQADKENVTITADTPKATANKATEPTVAHAKIHEAPQQALVKQPIRSNIPSTTSRTTAPRTFQDTQTCRHWCTHGHCKWGQQCRYRHTMPLTFHGLQEVGLNDWPAWFRSLNPGYFAAERPSPRRVKGRCNGGCDDGCRGGMQLGITHARAERLRGADDKRGEMVIKRLKEEMMDAKSKGVKEKGVSGSIMLERASMRDTKNWEDDEESETSNEMVEKVDGEKDSLLD